MITTSEEYFANLYKIQNKDYSNIALLLPSDEKIYSVDLNSRIIEAPEFVGVTEDHDAEIIYFIMDRFYDNMDMAMTTGIIKVVTANNEARIYPIPYYDVETYSTIDENGIATDKIIFPWIISKEITKKDGTIDFTMNFYTLDAIDQQYLFNLNLLPAKTKVLSGIEMTKNIKDGYNFEMYGNYLADEYMHLLERIKYIEEKEPLYWQIEE